MLAPHLKGIAAMVVAMAFFVGNDTLMKLLTAGIPPGQFVTVRGLIAAGLIAVVMLVLFGRRSFSGALGRAASLRTLAEAGALAFYIVALMRLPIGDAVALVQTTPLLMLPVAAIVLKERIGAWRWVLVAIGFVGVILVARPGSGIADTGALWAAGAALVAAGFQVLRDMLSKAVPAETHPFAVTWNTLALIAVLALVLVPFETWRPLTPSEIGLTVACAVFLASGHVCLYLAFRVAKASTVAPYFYCGTAFALVSGMVVFGDVPHVLEVVGITLIVATGLALAREEKTR